MATINEDNFGKIKVELVKHKSSADLLVYITKTKSEAKGKDFIWFFDDKYGKTKVKFVKYSSDVKVFYVDRKNEAKWNKPHKLTGRFDD